MGEITAPHPLTKEHDVSDFDCGHATLNEWLSRRALKNEGHGASRTFVVSDEQGCVLGYYCLSTGAAEHEDSSGKVRRNMPSPIPIMVLGRLAVDIKYQNLSIGKGLLKDAILRTLNVAEQVGVRALLVHALSEEAKTFYTKQGFYPSPTNHMTLMITLQDIKASLS